MASIGEIGLRVRGVKASYGSRKNLRKVLNGITFDAMKGKITVVLGSSGAGKSTLINCVAGLQRIEAGEVQFIVDGGQTVVTSDHRRSLTPLERRVIGVCFQQSYLWSHMSVLDNLIHPQVWLKGIPRTRARQHAVDLLSTLGLEAHADAQVSQLSGGQRQRVAVLRALSIEPEVLLLDEITASQDPANVQAIFELVKGYVARTGCTALTISHDMQFVRKISDVVYLIEGGVIVDGATNAELSSGQLGPKLTDFTMAFEHDATVPIALGA